MSRSLVTDALFAVSDSHPEVVLYPVKDENGEGTVLGARVPLTWAARINELIKRPDFPWGLVLNNQSAFVRWCIGRGIIRLGELLEGSQMDPTMAAMAFDADMKGRLQSTALVIQNMKASIDTIAESCEVLLAHEEPMWAANQIGECLDGATKLDASWAFLFTKMMLLNNKMLGVVHSLMSEGILVNDYLVSVAHGLGYLLDIQASSAEEMPLEHDDAVTQEFD